MNVADTHDAHPGPAIERYGFFGWVWRFNALAIAGAAVLVMGFAAVLIADGVWNALRERPVQDVASAPAAGAAVPTGGTTLPTRTYYLGRAREVANRAVFAVPLHFRERHRRGVAYKQAHNTANIGYLDPRDASTRWLFDHNRHLILDSQTVHRQRADESGLEALATVHRVVRADTSGDGLLSQSDTATVLIAGPDGTRVTELFEAKGLLSAELVGNAVLLFYTDSTGGRVAAVNLADFSLRYDKVIEPPKG